MIDSTVIFFFNMLRMVGLQCLLPSYQVVRSYQVTSKPFKCKLWKHIKHQVRTVSPVLPNFALTFFFGKL